MKKLLERIKCLLIKTFKEINHHKLEYLLLFLILSFSAFFRLFHLDKLLGFWYDQGRDALVIWDLLHYRKFFLIGPVTGIEGIFLGPFYYYLLAPLYWLGKGSPVFAASGLSWLTVGTIFLLYWAGKKMFGATVGLLAAFLYGFSYSNVVFSRWLANPNPLPFFTMVLLLFLYGFVNGRKHFLIYAAFVLGLCLQLEAAAAAFFIPSVAVIVFWKRKQLNLKILFLAFLAFFITLIPQIYFNFRHQGILLEAFKKFLITDKSFGSLGHLGQSFTSVLGTRLLLYYDVFIAKLLPVGGDWKVILLALFSAGLIFFRKKIFNSGGRLLFLWLLVPLIGYVFYRGNNGYVWDYYFVGIIPAFFLLFSSCLYFLTKQGLFGKGIVYIFLIAFTLFNLRPINNFLKTGIGITLRAQTRAIDWMYGQAKGKPFNADFYVPPQIFYSYSYLMKWYGNGKFGFEPETKQIQELYTLYEPDGEHPQFLKAWLKRQDTIGKVISEHFWGDITVQKRERIKFDD